MICGSSIVESLILFYALYAITLLFEIESTTRGS